MIPIINHPIIVGNKEEQAYGKPSYNIGTSAATDSEI
jgi:hypothetical protein